MLADDGTLWLNLGDSYGRAPEKGGSVPNGKHDYIPSYGDARTKLAESARVGSSDGAVGRGDRPGTRAVGVKPKDLVGIPWRVAFALQADGWYLRQDIVWAKPNPMPESVTDRCTKAHEYVFLLAKSERYYWDQAAIQEPSSGLTGGRFGAGGPGVGRLRQDAARPRPVDDGTRNRRSVWTVPTHAAGPEWSHDGVVTEPSTRLKVTFLHRTCARFAQPHASSRGGLRVGSTTIAGKRAGRRSRRLSGLSRLSFRAT